MRSSARLLPSVSVSMGPRRGFSDLAGSVSAGRRAASASANEPPAAPKPLKLSVDLTYQVAPESENASGGSAPKLAVICGWMGAQPKQLKAYTKFYSDRGYDVLSYAVGPQHVLQPHTAMQLMQQVVRISIHGSEPGRVPSKVVTHCFSVGGYLTGQMLRLLNQPEHSADLKKFHSVVKAQVYDSPPDFRSIAKGIGASVGMGSMVAGIVESAVKFYLKISATTTGVEHLASSAHFHDNHLPAPSLWMYSKTDPVALEEDIHTVMGKWRKKGYVVEEVVWKDSPHIQHGRMDPDRYFTSLGNFLTAHVDVDEDEDVKKM